MKPITRLEHFLGRIAGNEEAKELAPITRKERILAKMAGDDIDVTPVTRKEWFLNDIAEHGMGPSPTGVIRITENGEHNVTEYATAMVAVERLKTATITISVTATSQPSATGMHLYITTVESSGVKEYSLVYEVKTITIPYVASASAPFFMRVRTDVNAQIYSITGQGGGNVVTISAGTIYDVPVVGGDEIAVDVGQRF